MPDPELIDHAPEECPRTRLLAHLDRTGGPLPRRHFLVQERAEALVAEINAELRARHAARQYEWFSLPFARQFAQEAPQ